MSTYFIVSSLFKHLFFISPLSQFLWTIWSEGALCRPSTVAEHSVKGASVAWTALHRKPIVGYEVWTGEQTGSEPCRKPADSTCAQCFHFKRQLHPPMTKVLRKLLSLSEAAQRLQPFSNNYDILCWSLELFELWGYFFPGLAIILLQRVVIHNPGYFRMNYSVFINKLGAPPKKTYFLPFFWVQFVV